MDVTIGKKVFLDIKAVLNKARLKFWLVDGIALGAIRSKSIIPYDQDFDLRVMNGDMDLFKLGERFKKAGFSVKLSINRPLYGELPSGIILNKNGIKTDMCVGYYYPPEDVIVVLAGAPRSNYDILPASMFRGNHFADICGVKARIPYPPEEYLERHYGKDWIFPVKTGSSPPDSKRISLKKYAEYFRTHPKVDYRRAKV